MLYTIEIKEPLAGCRQPLKGIVEKLHDTEMKMIELDAQLMDEGSWSGEAHSRCVAALKLIREYTDEIEKLFKEFDSCLRSVCADMQGFVSVSPAVCSWKRW